MFCPNVINAILSTFRIYIDLWRDLKQLKRRKKVEETTIRYSEEVQSNSKYVEHWIYDNGFGKMP